MLTVKQLRETKMTSVEDLKPFIYFLSDNMGDMLYGEFIAYKSTIEKKARELNIDLKTINKIAEDYQVFGYES